MVFAISIRYKWCS